MGRWREREGGGEAKRQGRRAVSEMLEDVGTGIQAVPD